MWGRSDRVIVTSGLSKAYGLPGLRIGWIVGAAGARSSRCGRITTTRRSRPARSATRWRGARSSRRTRERLLARTRGILNQQLSDHRAVARRAHGALFSYAPPDAGAIVYVRYHHAINSTELVTRLRVEKSVLVVPGDHFGMDHYLRLGFGDEPAHLRAGLERFGEAIVDSAYGLRRSDLQI